MIEESGGRTLVAEPTDRPKAKLPARRHSVSLDHI
jgi:hypothetical protein